MFVRFNTDWEGHKAGALADVEATLARRLIGLGVADHPREAVKKTTPQPVERKTEKETPPEPAKPTKKKPVRRYKAREKAVKIDG